MDLLASVASICVGMLMFVSLPGLLGGLTGYIRVKEKAREAEIKANLHNIQLSVERFAIDAEGTYPRYLIGGEARAAQQVDIEAGEVFSDVRECELYLVSDPLLRRGYIDAYPINPFIRNGPAIHELQEVLPTAREQHDLLRNGYEVGLRNGTRFGSHCTTMGNVLADPRYPDWSAVNLDILELTNEPTGADVEYRFWDMWVSDEPAPFLPGEFFYKSAGPMLATMSEDSIKFPVKPVDTPMYMLGTYGSIRTKGKDILGDERQLYVAGKAVWPWTRSQTDPAARGGSPYSSESTNDGSETLSFGNPNGIRDGIILVLTSGIDYSE